MKQYLKIIKCNNTSKSKYWVYSSKASVKEQASVKFDFRSLENPAENYFTPGLFFHTDGIVHGYHYFLQRFIALPMLISYVPLYHKWQNYLKHMMLYLYDNNIFPSPTNKREGEVMNFNHYKTRMWQGRAQNWALWLSQTRNLLSPC